MPAVRTSPAPEEDLARLRFKKLLEYVGRVQAIDKANAETVAAEEFKLRDHERTRLFIEEVRARVPLGQPLPTNA